MEGFVQRFLKNSQNCKFTQKRAEQFVEFLIGTRELPVRFQKFIDSNIAMRTALEHIQRWRKGFYQSIAIIQRALLDGASEKEAIAIARYLINGERTAHLSSRAMGIIRKSSRVFRKILSLPLRKLIPIFVALSVIAAAKRGYAGADPRYGAGWFGALCLGSKELVAANELEDLFGATILPAYDSAMKSLTGFSTFDERYESRCRQRYPATASWNSDLLRELLSEEISGQYYDPRNKRFVRPRK